MEAGATDEFLNRRQSVSFKIPDSSSENDLTTIDAASSCDRRGSDVAIQGPFDPSDDKRTNDDETVDFSVSRRGSQSSVGDVTFPVSVGNFVKGVSVIYAFVMAIIGLVMPIAEALTDSWMESIYATAFLTYELAVGFVFLLYLQFYQLRKSQSFQPVNLVGEASNADSNDGVRSRAASVFSRRQSIDGSTIWVDTTSFGDVFTHPETSLFLRLGTLVFSLANLIYYGFEIASYIGLDNACKSKYRFGWIFFLRFAFVLLQTYFLFKGPGIHAYKHIHGVWFGMLHLVSTNVCLWFRTVVHEIMEEVDFAQHSKHHDTDTNHLNNSTLREDIASNHSKSNCDDEMLHTLTRYLFPFILEYSLIAVGTITSILSIIVVAKENHGRSRLQDVRNNFRVVCLERRKLVGEADDRQQLALREGQVNILEKAHRGFYFGALVVAGTIVAIILFYLLSQKRHDDSLPSVIYHATDICLSAILLGSCVLAFIQMRPLGFVPKAISTDDVLLVIAMCGSVLYDVAVIISSSDALGQDRPDDKVDVLRLTSSLIAFVQVISQALFVLFSLRRYPAEVDHVERKPGRGAITALVIGNVTVWLLRTILAKGADMKTQEKFYGEVPWLLLMDANLPLALFFRFHSSICFADIWHLAYAPLKRNSQLSRSSSESVIECQPESCSRTQNSSVPTVASTSIFAVSQSGQSSSMISLRDANTNRPAATVRRSKSMTSLNSTLPRVQKKPVARFMNFI